MTAVINPPSKLYATGSRFFGTARANSDWDFFAQDSPAMRSWLAARRFTCLGSKGAPDVSLPFSVWENEALHVQVILYQDVWRKIVARDLVKLFFKGDIVHDLNSRFRVWKWVEHQVNIIFWFLPMKNGAPEPPADGNIF